MRVLLGLIGFIIVTITILDIVWTTLGRGGGPVTTRISSWLWKAALYYHKYLPSHRLLSVAGVVIVLITISIWILLVWIGWAFIFSVNEQAVVTAQGNRLADMVDRFYFVGFTLGTLGLGDYVPQGAVWQLATVLLNLQGFLLVTLAVTYLVPVVSAVTEKRDLAAYISCLGNTPNAIILKAWDGSNCRKLEQHLITLTPRITRLAQLHLTYPILHYFHTSDQNVAPAPRMAALDEALTIVEYGLDQECRIEPDVISPFRQAVWLLLKTLNASFIKPADEAPAVPPLFQLRSGGIPTISEKVFHSKVTDLAERRKLLLAFVQNDGWTWNDVNY